MCHPKPKLTCLTVCSYPSYPRGQPLLLVPRRQAIELKSNRLLLIIIVRRAVWRSVSDDLASVIEIHWDRNHQKGNH